MLGTASGLGLDGADVVDVATDKKMSGGDVGAELAHKGARWAGAAGGALAGGKMLGAAGLASPIPGAGPIGATVGAVGGGLAGYMMAGEAADATLGQAPSTRSNGVVTKFTGTEKPALIAERTREAHRASMEASSRAPIPGLASGAELASNRKAAAANTKKAVLSAEPATEQGLLLQRNHELNPNVAGLRAAGVVGNVVGDVTVNGRTGERGIRTIQGANNQTVYAGRDRRGQLVVNSGLEHSPKDADAARDAEFAARGYGKDTYGNWMTPQRVADKQQLAELQSERIQRDAFDPTITDPSVRASGLRQIMLREMQEGRRLEHEGLLARVNATQRFTPMQLAQLARENRAEARDAEKAAAEAAATRRKEGKEELAVMAGGDKEALARMHRAASGYADDPRLSGADNAQKKLRFAEMRQWVNEKGQHWLSAEKSDDGAATPNWKRRSHRGLADYARGYVIDQPMYEDKVTGQVISASELADAPEAVRRAFYDHIGAVSRSANK